MNISIVTAVYNARATIGRTIASVRNQTHPHIEHIVVDGASTDGTTELLRSEESGIDVLVSEPDRGLYDGLNKGILRATGDVVGILHGDDFYADERVLSDVAACFEASAAEVVLGDVVYVSRDDPEHKVRWYRAEVWNPERFVSGWMPPHPGFFVRRSHYRRLGLYKSDYAIAADYDLLIRFLYTARLPYAFLGRAAVHMRRGGISTRGLKSNWILNREIVRACEENGLRTSMARLLLRYPAKMLELRPSSRNRAERISDRIVPQGGSLDNRR